MSDSPAIVEVHLLACVHGMWGQPSHVTRMAEIMRETHAKAEDGVELDVLVAETNRQAHTYDGVDWGAERVVQEVKDRIAVIETPGANPRKKVTRFSIFGYSLGGLLSRYAVGILYSTGFFDDGKVKPVNFATIATPNLGLLKYGTFLSSVQHTFGPIFLSRTGKHFYAKDADEWGAGEGKPLLEVMSEKGSVFYDALAKFQSVTFVANAINDITVPFITASAEAYDPFVAYTRNGVEINLDEKYAPVIKSFQLPSGPAPTAPARPRKFSRAWWRAKWNAPSKLPPPLQFAFPFNIVAWALLPILFPLFVATAMTNLGYNTFHSRRRIKLLESSGQGNRSAIVSFMQRVERRVEDTVLDMSNDGMNDEYMGPDAGPSNMTTASPSRAGTPLPPLPGTSTPLKEKTRPPRRMSITYTPLADPNSRYQDSYPSTDTTKEKQNQPLLTETQRRIIANLNTLPNLKKVYVFIDGVPNSHATIVCRDPKGFSFHRRGEGVLRYLADGFEM
ncbi:hypothetical protein M407DRAFT_25944 [Tulasnella calospora MUT 4182]|uniref:DUF676 domain-containing protein n=1 Tax=Tulasnella calospora MUT 4182 TaxID=1051891 RepID=A0A0C3KT93_9AGAM|nr:hypothetical protein M407DRAFT_25944 [Tulasnella calospora MUT 4182]